MNCECVLQMWMIVLVIVVLCVIICVKNYIFKTSKNMQAMLSYICIFAKTLMHNMIGMVFITVTL